MSDLFRNPVKSVPTSDSQIVRVNMEEIEIGGRKSHLPAQSKSDVLPINHVPNASSTPGGK
jgi:hypothetical protein